MIEDHPGPQFPRKIVLPARSPEERLAPSPPSEPTHRVFVHPDQLNRQPPVTGTPLQKMQKLWNVDPAYKVLFIAICLVLVIGLIFAVFLVNTLTRISPPAQSNQVVVTPGATTQAKATVDTNPAFPTPGGNKGSKKSSLPPPSAKPTYAPTPTQDPNSPTPGPTTSDPNVATVQIVSAPESVSNNDNVAITVSTSQPGAAVSLMISYDVPPGFAMSNTKQTDSSGQATLQWHVHVSRFGQNALARVTAIAQMPNGQRVSSQTVTIRINVN